MEENLESALEQVQEKIVELAGQIGATAITEVKRLRGGSHNRIISTTVGSADNPTSEMTGVFRIPWFTITDEDDSADTFDRRILDQVALSILLAKHGVPAPRILAFDATSANAIHSPYTFQKLATGTRLDEVYDKMSLQEKRLILYKDIPPKRNHTLPQKKTKSSISG